MTPEIKLKTRTLIKNGEGCITHMYLDTAGKVTIGVGNMLPTAEAATEHPFVREDSGEPATIAEVTDEFNLLNQQEKGRLAENYKQYTKLILTDQYIDELLDGRIEEFEQQLKRDFTNFDNYPEPAQQGLVDMAFNLGNKGLIDKFPTFTKAAREEDWSACQQECRRRGISDTRNDEVKTLFGECIPGVQT